MKIRLNQTRFDRKAMADTLAMVEVFGSVDDDFGKFCRGVEHGIKSVLHGLGFKGREEKIIPDRFPKPKDCNAAFISIYASYLSSQDKPLTFRAPQDMKEFFDELKEDAKKFLNELKMEEKGGD